MTHDHSRSPDPYQGKPKGSAMGQEASGAVEETGKGERCCVLRHNAGTVHLTVSLSLKSARMRKSPARLDKLPLIT